MQWAIGVVCLSFFRVHLDQVSVLERARGLLRPHHARNAELARPNLLPCDHRNK